MKLCKKNVGVYIEYGNTYTSNLYAKGFDFIPGLDGEIPLVTINLEINLRSRNRNGNDHTDAIELLEYGADKIRTIEIADQYLARRLKRLLEVGMKTKVNCIIILGGENRRCADLVIIDPDSIKIDFLKGS